MPTRSISVRLAEASRLIAQLPGPPGLGKCISQVSIYGSKTPLNRSNIRLREIQMIIIERRSTMDGQPGQEDGEGAGRDRDPEPTPPASGSPVPNPAPLGPDPRLAQFAWDDSREGPAPSGRMALTGRRAVRAGAALPRSHRRRTGRPAAGVGGGRVVGRERQARRDPGDDAPRGPSVAWQRPRRPAGGLVPVAALRAGGRAGVLDPVGREHRVARVAAGSAAAPHRRPAGRRDADQPEGQGRGRDPRPADRPRRRRRGSPDRRPVGGQDLHPGAAPGRAGGPDGGPGAGRAMAGARAED